jgi:rRNA small subunit pseudouridine methyltransferase Nep1
MKSAKSFSHKKEANDSRDDTDASYATKRRRLNQSEEESEENTNENNEEEDDITSMLSMQNEANKFGKNTFQRRDAKRLIVVLENACLESVKVGQSYELLNCDKHKQQIIKYKKDPSQCRPDILHQCLLMLFDSPLNRVNLLQVYVHTQKNVLIEINPQTRIPRTFDRFSGLMVQLLHKLSIRAADSSQKLLKVIKNPITDHLPVGCPKYLASFQAECVMHANEFAKSLPDNEPIVVVVGAMAKGSVDCSYTTKCVSISNYPLSAALACSKFCSAFEDKWNVL